MLEEVDGRRPLDVLNELYAAADPHERALLRHSLLIGLEMRPERERYGRGDFLMRNLTGIDTETGSLEIAALLRERQIVQLHVRDARSAHADLAERFARYGRAGDARGELHVRIGARFPLAQAAEAHRALEGRGTSGKLLLVP